ncbi:ABC transporter ATP-binding protein [Vibrio cortegadensis]|uniref:ABC transporter ATP-binding protein n=1 Tax=Vibrio cortegadensis TaxID=1328770 RepID=UPI00352DBA0C
MMSVNMQDAPAQASLNRSVLSVEPGEWLDIISGYLRYQDSEQPIISRLNMRMPIKQWTCILGRSGCGKSSLLRYLAGLLEGKAEWRGELKLCGNDKASQAIAIDGHIAYMAQQDLLMPWLSVLDNVLLSDKFGSSAIEHQQAKALELLNRVGLAGKAQLLPQQLSGGMRQRVALARTLLQDKPIVLMDEPFSALDAVTRYRLQNLAYELLADKTVVLITHDPQEAIRLAHQLYIIQGTPAFAQSLNIADILSVPDSEMPRKFDSNCAQLQQCIIEQLESDYE